MTERVQGNGIVVKLKGRPDRGGVITEFAVSIPVIVVFLVGILSSGRALNQIAAVTQAAFLGAQVGADLSTTSEMDQVINARVNRIMSLQKNPLKCAGDETCVTSTVIDVPNRLIEVTTRGELNYIFRSLKVDIKVAAPMLLINSDTNAGINLSVPENPAGIYRCIGADNAACNCCSTTGPKDYCPACSTGMSP